MQDECTGPAAQELNRLRRRLDRERKARLDAEAIAEKGLRELYDNQQQLRLLERIATAANQTVSLQDICQFALTQVCDFTGWPVGHLYLTDTAGDARRLRSSRIWHAEDLERIAEFRRVTERTDFKSGQGLPGRIQETGAPAWISDIGEDGNFPRQRAAQLCGLNAAYAFPILIGSEVAAVIEFFIRNTIELDQVLMRLVSQIGLQLGRVMERKRAEDQLIHDASHDPLTGLPNRALFRDRLDQLFARNGRNEATGFAVLFIDLDRFKLVNDGLGHGAGDKLIVKVAGRLQASLRRVDLVAGATAGAAKDRNTVARLGGDEFIVLLADMLDPTDAVRVADRIQEALRPCFIVDGQELHVTSSIGIATSAIQYRSVDDMVRDADLAMLHAKSQGKARSVVYDKTMCLPARRRLRLENELRQALQNGEFILHCQPIVSVGDQAVTGFEALVRWQPPGHDLVYPDKFIRIAEETGLIVPLGLWVLQEACRTTRQWQRAFPRSQLLTISVNLSARQFIQPDLVGQVREILEETGIDPGTVRLEVTESVTMGNAERAIGILLQLKGLGIQLSLDDFGTGYSSLSYLQRFPLDILKIDRSFVSAMCRSPESLQIVGTIISLARNLNMLVVAEGAEMEAEVSYLTALRCDYIQGYFFSKPIDRMAATTMLQSSALWGCPAQPCT
jgi:diguanylate cyclase (GGDEF)-like protein